MKHIISMMVFGGLFSFYVNAVDADPAANQLLENDPTLEMYIGSYRVIPKSEEQADLPKAQPPKQPDKDDQEGE